MKWTKSWQNSAKFLVSSVPYALDFKYMHSSVCYVLVIRALGHLMHKLLHTQTCIVAVLLPPFWLPVHSVRSRSLHMLIVRYSAVLTLTQ